MASGGLGPAPANKGRTFTKTSVKNIGQAVAKSYLRNRMKADDSATVCMSDKKLGKGISSN